MQMTLERGSSSIRIPFLQPFPLWLHARCKVPRYKAYDYFIEHDSAAGEHGIEIDRGAIDVVTSFEFKRPRSQSVFAFRYVMRSQELASPVDELNEEHRFFQFNWQSFFH